MKSSGEIRLLEAQGIEPFLYLLMPRVVGLAISTFCLAIIFNVLTFLSGFFYGSYISHTAAEPLGFIDSVFTSFRGLDAVNILLKSLVPPLLTGIICCTEGLNIAAGISEVPLATKRALSRSLVALFVISAVISLISYG
jgi:phospholipid/cholesterol/gamma-HCH transport system permease protein